MNSKYKEWLDYLAHGIHKEDTSFLRFAVLWLSFNAYLNEISNTKTIRGDWKKVEEFSKDPKNIEFFNKYMIYEEIAQGFKDTKPQGRDYVEDLKDRKVDRRKNLRLNDDTENKLGKYLSVIYQIRCNFFHGDKIPNDPDDKNLVDWAFNSFHEFWSKYIKYLKL